MPMIVVLCFSPEMSRERERIADLNIFFKNQGDLIEREFSNDGIIWGD